MRRRDKTGVDMGSASESDEYRIWRGMDPAHPGGDYTVYSKHWWDGDKFVVKHFSEQELYMSADQTNQQGFNSAALGDATEQFRKDATARKWPNSYTKK